MNPPPLKFAIFGTGFWARFQLAGWREVPGAECVALYNRTRTKAESLARDFGITRIYDDPEALLDHEQLDFIDIISDPSTHAHFCALAARRGLHAICQKPMATSYEEAAAMEALARQCGTKLYIHENFRWQKPFREIKTVLDSGAIGRPFRAQIDMVSGFNVFANQPFLREIEQFILTDLGSHTLDVARYLFGEARSLYCLTARTLPDIRGENVSTHLLEMGPEPVTVGVRMAYACNSLERECFPQTLVFVEGTEGSLELDQHLNLRVTDRSGTRIRRLELPYYPWCDPRYAIVHTSIVPCNHNILRALQGGPEAETTATDNLRTLRLVYASYDSSQTGQVVRF